MSRYVAIKVVAANNRIANIVLIKCTIYTMLNCFLVD